MGTLGVINSYTVRILLSVAITVMAKPLQKKNSTVIDPYACPEQDVPRTTFYKESTRTFLDNNEVYDWSFETQGLMGSAFYAGYLLGHLPAMFFSKRFGGKHFLGFGILIAAITTLATPLVLFWTKGNAVVMCLTRFIIGVAVGGTFPALNEILAHWIPLSERSTISTMIFSGCILGTIIGQALTGIVTQSHNWSSAFYLFGWLAVAWWALWTFLCYSEPDTHPFISEKERVFLVESIGASPNKKRKIPWKKIFTNPPVIACVFMQVGHDWVYYTLVTDLPKYMTFVLKFNVKNSGLWSSLPYLAMWLVAISTGVLADWLIRKEYCSIVFVRKLFTTFCKTISAIFLVAASYSGCQIFLVVGMFTCGVGVLGFFYSGSKVNMLDLSVNYAGFLMGLINGFGCLAGIAVPYLDGVVAKDQTMMQWRTVIWISFAIAIFSNIVFVVFGSGTRQAWDYVDGEGDAADPAAGASKS